MAVLDIVTYPDSFLKEPTREVEAVDDDIRRMIADMADTMYAAPGIGLAANQVGFDKRILIYDLACREGETPDLRVLINPEIVSADGQQLSENEGCLSVPDFRADVNRYATVRVQALDGDGRPLDFDADGMEAIVLQHEIDHLNGILFIDRISALKRQMYKRRIRKQAKQQ